MVAEEGKIVRSVRANKEVFARIQDIAKEKGMDQGATLEALVNAWDVQNAKGLVPERAADIADFDAAIQRIQSAFLRSLELATGAESRARNTYAAQLDLMAAEIARLKADLAEAQEAADSAGQELGAAITENERLKADLAEARKTQSLEALLTAVAAKLDGVKPETAKRKRGGKVGDTEKAIQFPVEAEA